MYAAAGRSSQVIQHAPRVSAASAAARSSPAIPPPPRATADRSSAAIPPPPRATADRSSAAIPPPPPATTASDSDFTSDSSDSDSPAPSSALHDSILSAYLRTSTSSSPDLAKIRSFLSSSVSCCLICLVRIRPTDAVWSCSASCHALFHLPCIQSWAQQSSHRPLPATALAAPTDWHCPKCRLPYPNSQIPRSYRCFCGKLEDPPADPWILPHSCNEICGAPLRPACGHHCLLLCHPGPCPPCPQSVTACCFCGSTSSTRRCASKHFSCNRPCPHPLPCNTHPCTARCHEGPCPPCRVRDILRCQCGRVEEERECCERGFRCDKPCGKSLNCGKHECGRGCHEGPCGDCPMQGRRTCPCGKKEYRGVSCDAEVSNCGSTCEKMLGCNLHRCSERCHRGACVEMCMTVVVKSCRCGSLRKEVPCYQDVVCERKCQQVRDCGRHACKRRCCDGDCPPCPEICGRKLRCSNHKCPSPCHRGACAPCPLVVFISCSCGETQFEVPCGAEKSQKPPRCRKPCRISRLCRHESECRPHKCHYGACPPCRAICGEKFSCGHSCKQRCHGPTPPPNPEYTLKPRKKKVEKQIEFIPGSPCPPCQEIILMSCHGQHIGEERSMLCSSKRQFSCQNLCGNLLSCGNHYCTKPCHVLLSSETKSRLAEPCEKCLLPCQKVREPACLHPCPLLCHSDACSPCKVLVKRSCHCGAMVHVFECMNYGNLTEKEQLRLRSCGGPCHKKLPNCPHLCSEICHHGDCLVTNQCTKKVNVRCACNNLKKEWICKDVQSTYYNAGRDPKDVSKSQFGVGLLPCNADCASKVKVVDSDLQLRKTKVIQSTGKDDAANVPKRKKRRERVQEVRQISKFQIIKATIWKCLLFIFISLAVFMCVYYGYKGLLWVNDWMNEIEERRMRRNFP